MDEWLLYTFSNTICSVIFVINFIKNKYIRYVFILLPSVFLSFFMLSNLVFFNIFKNFIDFFSISIIIENLSNIKGYIRGYLDLKNIFILMMFSLFFWFIFYLSSNIVIKYREKNNKFKYLNKINSAKIILFFTFAIVIFLISSHSYSYRKFIAYNTEPEHEKPLFLNHDAYATIGIL